MKRDVTNKEVKTRSDLTGEGRRYAKHAMQTDLGRGDALVPLAGSESQSRLEGKIAHILLEGGTLGDYSSVGRLPVNWVEPRSDRMTFELADEAVKPFLYRILRDGGGPILRVHLPAVGLVLKHHDDDNAVVYVSTPSRRDLARTRNEVYQRQCLSPLAAKVRLNSMLTRPGEDAQRAAYHLSSGMLRCWAILKDPSVGEAASTFGPHLADGSTEWLGPALPEKLGWIRMRTALHGVVARRDAPSRLHLDGPVVVTDPSGQYQGALVDESDAVEIAAASGIDWTALRGGGEMQWYDTLVRYFQPRLIASALRRTGCHLYDAQDIAAATLETAWGKRWQVQDNPGPWLFTTLRYLLYNRYRYSLRRPTDYVDLDEIRSSHTELDDMVTGRAVLNQALAGLPKNDRSLLEAYFFQGTSYLELAYHYGISIPTARKRVERSLERLRRVIDGLGGIR